MGDGRAWSHRGWDGDDGGVLASVQLWSWTPVTGRSLESPSPGLSPCRQPCQEVGTSACTPPGTGTHASLSPGLVPSTGADHLLPRGPHSWTTPGPLTVPWPLLEKPNSRSPGGHGQVPKKPPWPCARVPPTFNGPKTPLHHFDQTPLLYLAFWGALSAFLGWDNIDFHKTKVSETLSRSHRIFLQYWDLNPGPTP
jgi:hypothetical protein